MCVWEDTRCSTAAIIRWFADQKDSGLVEKVVIFFFVLSLLFFQKNVNEQTCEAGLTILLKKIQWNVCSNNCKRERYVRQRMGEKFSVSIRKSLFDESFIYSYIINSVLTSCHSSGDGCCQVSLLSACCSVYMFILRQRWCGAKRLPHRKCPCTVYKRQTDTLFSNMNNGDCLVSVSTTFFASPFRA